MAAAASSTGWLEALVTRLQETRSALAAELELWERVKAGATPTAAPSKAAVPGGDSADARPFETTEYDKLCLVLRQLSSDYEGLCAGTHGVPPPGANASAEGAAPVRPRPSRGPSAASGEGSRPVAPEGGMDLTGASRIPGIIAEVLGATRKPPAKYRTPAPLCESAICSPVLELVSAAAPGSPQSPARKQRQATRDPRGASGRPKPAGPRPMRPVVSFESWKALAPLLRKEIALHQNGMVEAFSAALDAPKDERDSACLYRVVRQLLGYSPYVQIVVDGPLDPASRPGPQ